MLRASILDSMECRRTPVQPDPSRAGPLPPPPSAPSRNPPTMGPTMTTPRLTVRKAAVLGAGVMGAQIAAHLANANVDVLLFDLPARDGEPNAIVDKAIQCLARLSPAPLAEPSRQGAITPAIYDQHLDLLRGCDLVIEAIAERMDWKRDLYSKIAPYVSENAVLASNTS